jgi:ferredoxin-type protein NapH
MKNSRRFGLFLMLLLLPVTLNYFSPYLIIDGLINKVAAGAFFVWLAMFITSLFFGRAFCAYVCPYGGLQMTTDLVLQRPLKQIPWLRKVRYILGLIWLGAILIAFISNIGSIKIDFFYLTESFASVDNIQKLIFYYVIVVSLSLMPVFLGKRATCHYLCPMLILNVAGTKIKNAINIPSLRLQTDSSKCVGCKQCTKACPMSLKVHDMVRKENMNNNDCILCGECCKACKAAAIKRVYGKKPSDTILKDKSTIRL